MARPCIHLPFSLVSGGTLCLPPLLCTETLSALNLCRICACYHSLSEFIYASILLCPQDTISLGHPSPLSPTELSASCVHVDQNGNWFSFIHCGEFKVGLKLSALGRCSLDRVGDFKVKETNWGHCLFSAGEVGTCVCPVVPCVYLDPVIKRSIEPVM